VQPSASTSAFDLLGSTTSPPAVSQASSSQSAAFSQHSSTQLQRSTPDPFASLTSPAPRQASPFQFQQSVNNSGANDLLGMSSPAPSSGLAQSSSAAANDDDEWTFESAVPDQSKEITVLNSSLNVVFKVSRESDTVLLVQNRISNNTPQPVSGLTFQVAVSKVSV
jgi:ADP-ribosylation factor-binding protein GGA